MDDNHQSQSVLWGVNRILFCVNTTCKFFNWQINRYLNSERSWKISHRVENPLLVNTNANFAKVPLIISRKQFVKILDNPVAKLSPTSSSRSFWHWLKYEKLTSCSRLFLKHSASNDDNFYHFSNLIDMEINQEIWKWIRLISCILGILDDTPIPFSSFRIFGCLNQVIKFFIAFRKE